MNTLKEIFKDIECYFKKYDIIKYIPEDEEYLNLKQKTPQRR